MNLVVKKVGVLMVVAHWISEAAFYWYGARAG